MTLQRSQSSEFDFSTFGTCVWISGYQQIWKENRAIDRYTEPLVPVGLTGESRRLRPCKYI